VVLIGFGVPVRAQEFEMIPTVTRVIVVDDDASTSYSGWEDDLECYTSLEDEEWEQLESSEEESSEEDEEIEPSHPLNRRTYAQVLTDR
jgi:hypothetical protein